MRQFKKMVFSMTDTSSDRPGAQTSSSISISGGQLSNVQIGGQAGRDLHVSQSQIGNETVMGEALSSSDVVALLDQIKDILQKSDLSAVDKEKVVRSLEGTKDEVQSDDPDKLFAAKTLQRATNVLKDAGETVEAGTSLWDKIKPIMESVSPWLGVTARFFI